ncbi:hypothetical protein JHW43_001430 [Diplocarpon mali]|nr:hypothetical protein JHW43_001430 [Diplocarpon mali]
MRAAPGPGIGARRPGRSADSIKYMMLKSTGIWDAADQQIAPVTGTRPHDAVEVGRTEKAGHRGHARIGDMFGSEKHDTADRRHKHPSAPRSTAAKPRATSSIVSRRVYSYLPLSIATRFESMHHANGAVSCALFVAGQSSTTSASSARAIQVRCSGVHDTFVGASNSRWLAQAVEPEKEEKEREKKKKKEKALPGRRLRCYLPSPRAAQRLRLGLRSTARKRKDTRDEPDSAVGETSATRCRPPQAEPTSPLGRARRRAGAAPVRDSDSLPPDHGTGIARTVLRREARPRSARATPAGPHSVRTAGGPPRIQPARPVRTLASVPSPDRGATPTPRDPTGVPRGVGVSGPVRRLPCLAGRDGSAHQGHPPSEHCLHDAAVRRLPPPPPGRSREMQPGRICRRLGLGPVTTLGPDKSVREAGRRRPAEPKTGRGPARLSLRVTFCGAVLATAGPERHPVHTSVPWRRTAARRMRPGQDGDALWSPTLVGQAGCDQLSAAAVYGKRGIDLGAATLPWRPPPSSKLAGTPPAGGGSQKTRRAKAVPEAAASTLVRPARPSPSGFPGDAAASPRH